MFADPSRGLFRPVLVFTAVLILLAGPAVRVLAPGLSRETAETATVLLRITSLAIPALAGSALFTALLYSGRRFAVPAFHQSVVNIITIAVAAFTAGRSGPYAGVVVPVARTAAGASPLRAGRAGRGGHARFRIDVRSGCHLGFDHCLDAERDRAFPLPARLPRRAGRLRLRHRSLDCVRVVRARQSLGLFPPPRSATSCGVSFPLWWPGAC